MAMGVSVKHLDANLKAWTAMSIARYAAAP
jgi:hypothetical protein